MKWFWFLILGVVPLSSLASPQSFPSADALKLSRDYLSSFYDGQTAALWKNMTPQMQAAMKTEADFAGLTAKINSQLGKETAIANERVMPGPHAQIYTRLARFAAVPMPIVVTFSFDDRGKVAGLLFRPAPNPAESKYLDYKDKSTYSIPLQGTWLVYQGGRSTYDNYHAEVPDERFAYDIVDVKNGKLYSGSGEKLDDYFGFGKPVPAPADGTVVAVVDQYDDNPLLQPSSSNPKQGNNIVIDHGNEEFSMLAHLETRQHKSENRREGESRRGNRALWKQRQLAFSASAFHLQTTAEWFHGDGLPIQFHQYVSDGKTVDFGEPIRGEVVERK